METKPTVIKEASISLMSKFATKYNIDPSKMMDVLKGTVMKPDKDGRVATNEEVAGFLIVANQYDLNPFTKEIYAFPDKRAGIVPIVSTDGWTKLMASHKDYRTHNFRYSENVVTPKGGKPCPEWCEIEIERKDGSKTVIREYLDEVYRLPFEGKARDGGTYEVSGPWQSHTKRMLRHKTKIQGARETFGFSGIYDEDEAIRIIESTSPPAINAPVEMPKAIDQPKSEPQKDTPVEFVSSKQRQNLEKIAAQAGISDMGYVDFLSGIGIDNPDQITVEKYREALNAVMQQMDGKAKVSTNAKRA